jgi:ribosomal protein S18 acetylase RimI-like enzyme
MEIRRATEDDAESILAFWRSSNATTGSTDEVKTVRGVAGNPAAVFLLAVENGQIIGSLIGTFDGWRGHMSRLVVRPDRRRQGIARQLIRQVEAVFSERSVKRIYALVEVDQPVAQAFWAAMGYPANQRVRLHARTAD